MIEGAFLKIPEVLNSYGDDFHLYESSITNLFSNSLILELNARNIDNPLNKIFFEKRYNPKINRRCDIYANFDFIDKSLFNYGYYKENYIEVKYFGNISKMKGTVTKSQNAGSIIYDIYRLIQGKECINNQGLYSLVIFDDDPTKYLAFARKDKSKRYWVEKLLKPGIHELHFVLSDEPSSIKKIFKKDILESIELEIKIKIRVLTFNPIHSDNGFHGSLIQVLEVY